MEARKWGGGGRIRSQHRGAQKGQQGINKEAQGETGIEDTENRKDLWKLTCRAGYGRVLLCVGPESNICLSTLMGFISSGPEAMAAS